MKPLAFATFAITALAACATSGDAPADGDAGSSTDAAATQDGGAEAEASATTADQACKANATGYCQHMQQCFPQAITASWGDVATCVAAVAPSCAKVLAAPGDGWTPDRLMACIRARELLACDAFLLRKPELADCAITGAIADGAACRWGAQCKSGYCKITSGSCGNCVTPVARGGACTTYSDCAAELLCAKNDTCQSPVANGGACDDAHPCALGTACIAGACKKPGGEGADCDPMNGGVDCDYYQWVWCSGASKKCTKYKFGKAGDPCSVANEAIVCEAGGGCLNGACAAAGGDATLCDPAKGINCASPLSCDMGTCKLVDANQCK